jgi:hemerythrin-like domain-containing protein
MGVSMKATKSRSIVQLIKEDHKPLKESIKILTSERSTEAAKKKALRTFLMDLKLHAKAEEMSLYKNTVTQDDIRVETLEGYQEHAIADFLAKQLERKDFESNWTDEIEAKAKVLAELVEHHAKEEEKEVLPELSKIYEREELNRLGDLYLQKYEELKVKFGTEKAAGSKRTASKKSETKLAPEAAAMM